MVTFHYFKRNMLPMNSDFAIIDSNLERASEGLRVLDEIARFITVQEGAFAELKAIRHDLQDIGAWFGPARLVGARTVARGREVKVIATEAIRSTAWSMIRASVGRAAESFRILEEFSKIYAAQATEFIKHSRYAVYVLEKQLLQATPHYYLRRYFERGVVYPLSDSVEEILWLVEHGAQILQLRDKKSSHDEIFKKAKYLSTIIAEKNKAGGDQILLIVNDYPEIAAELPVAGVHVGQEDGAVAAARCLVGSNKIIGRSNHSIEQIRTAVADGADYVSIGPVYVTPTKPERQAVGLELVRQVADEITVPWLALGGIDEATIHDVHAAGAKNVAVVRSARNFFQN